MANTNQTQTQQQLDECGLTHERRSAHYKPNIWSYDFVQSLTTKFSGKTYEDQVKKLKNKFMQYFSCVPESSKPYIVENIRKLGLANVFHKEIKLVLDSILFNINNNKNASRFEEDDDDDDILATIALQFRLLRHHGYDVSQDVLVDFIDDKVNLLLNKQTPNSKCNPRGILELLEASHLAVEGDEKLMMIKAKAFSYHGSHDQLPCHWKTMWFDVRQQIHAYEMEDNHNNILLELASLNFNIVQAIHLQDLKEMSRWWKSLGLIENIGFTRDRLVESFLWTVGVACESQYSVLRKCLTKLVLFVLVLDDAYDIYGSFQELHYFTKIVERWNYGDEDGEQLPDCLKLCFEALTTTCHEIALDILNEKGWNYDIVLDFLKMAWADFCKALLQEAWWYKKHHIPSLEDYLKCAWITSSGSLLSLIAFLCTANGKSEDLKNKWEDSQQLIYYTSLVIRLLNDQGTSDAEFERGDAYSSILCYMEEENVTEAIARKHIKEMIVNAWTKINMELLRASSEQQAFVNLVINSARVCHFIYQKGDGFSVQDGYTKNKIKLLLIQPIQL